MHEGDGGSVNVYNVLLFFSKSWRDGHIHMGVRIPGQRRPSCLSFLVLSHLGSGCWKALLDAASEGCEKTQAKTLVHEAIDNRIHAGGGVGEQMDEGDGRS